MPSVMSHPARKRASPQKVLPARARFWRKPVRVELPQRKSELHPERFSPSRSIFGKNPLGWSFPSAKAGATPKGFACPEAFLTKTRAGGASPTQKRGTNRAHVRGWWFRQASTAKTTTASPAGSWGVPKPCWEEWEGVSPNRPPLRRTDAAEREMFARHGCRRFGSETSVLGKVGGLEGGKPRFASRGVSSLQKPLRKAFRKPRGFPLSPHGKCERNPAVFLESFCGLYPVERHSFRLGGAAEGGASAFRHKIRACARCGGSRQGSRRFFDSGGAPGVFARSLRACPSEPGARSRIPVFFIFAFFCIMGA